MLSDSVFVVYHIVWRKMCYLIILYFRTMRNYCIWKIVLSSTRCSKVFQNIIYENFKLLWLLFSGLYKMIGCDTYFTTFLMIFLKFLNFWKIIKKWLVFLKKYFIAIIIIIYFWLNTNIEYVFNIIIILV